MCRFRPLVVCLLSGALVAPAWALHDPTRPTDPGSYFAPAGDSASPWVLQSILSSPDRRVAVINGTRVSEGARIGGAKVLSIKPTHVVLRTGKGSLTLRLWNDNIKKVTP